MDRRSITSRMGGEYRNMAQETTNKAHQSRDRTTNSQKSGESSTDSISAMSFNEQANSASGPSSSRSDQQIEEEIEGDVDSEVVSDIAETAASVPSQSVKQKARLLFGLDTGGPSAGAPAYDSDELLSGDKLAEHFQIQYRTEESLDQLFKGIDDSTIDEDVERNNESPQNDVILINDQKVSINSLKERQETRNSATTNYSTTNEISDLMIDETSLQLLPTKSLLYGSGNDHTQDVSVGDERSYTGFDENPPSDDGSKSNASVEEEDKSVEEMIMSNHSLELVRSNRSTGEDPPSLTLVPNDPDQISPKVTMERGTAEPVIIVKPMERCMELSREVLEDISEESEDALESLESLNKVHVYAISQSNDQGQDKLKKTASANSFFESQELAGKELVKVNDPASLPSFDQRILTDVGDPLIDLESVISLNMMTSMENKIRELEGQMSGKDVLLASLSLQLGALSRRDSRDSLRENMSIITNSTEYRTIHDDYVTKMVDIQAEIMERDNLIEQLTDSLQQSLQERQQLHAKGTELASEVEKLKGQLSLAVETLKQPRFNYSDCKRLSDESLDLIGADEEDNHNAGIVAESGTNLSQQLTEFRGTLAGKELEVFAKVQQKFDAYMEEQIGKMRMSYDGEIKILNDRLETEKNENQMELMRLRELLSSVRDGSVDMMTLRDELQVKHSLEMESLRRYFEKKCVDMEKHYSEEVFSQQSQKHSLETDGSDASDVDCELPLELCLVSPKRSGRLSESMPNSPRTRKTDSNEIQQVYAEKIKAMECAYEEQIKALKEKLKRFEVKKADQQFMINPVPVTTTTTIANDTNIEPNELTEIIAEYERRLQEQVKLAKQDVFIEFERQIQALLTETATEDSDWPPELILLREKFTAQNQLQITQLQIKHAEEMDRVKVELNRKQKRQRTFDTNRNLDRVVSERDNLRELSLTLRRLLHELAKYCSICEADLNQTLADELRRHGAFSNPNDTNSGGIGLSEDAEDANCSTQSTTSNSSKRRSKFNLDVSGILSAVDNPSLIDFINCPNEMTELEFNLEQCLEKLQQEASSLLKLSENLSTRDGVQPPPISLQNGDHEAVLQKHASLNESNLSRSGKGEGMMLMTNGHSKAHSLPIYMNTEDDRVNGNEKITVNELKNRLLKSEDERKSLEVELNAATMRNRSLSQELDQHRQAIEVLEGRREYVSEGFGSHSPVKVNAPQPRLSFGELQKKAKSIILSQKVVDGTANDSVGPQLSQLIEDFCREGDRSNDENRREKEDLQCQNKKCTSKCDLLIAQIDAADKQLRDTRKFLEEQATEREHERDEFAKEIDRLKAQLRDRDKDKSNSEVLKKEDLLLAKIETLEGQMKELLQSEVEGEEKRQRLEEELKASVDKIFVLREIITGLEIQIETNNSSEKVLHDRITELEAFIAAQNRANEALQQEVESFKQDMDARGYQGKIIELEDKLQSCKPSAEQSLVFEQLADQLKEIETILEAKTRTLESLHADICSHSCSSPSEDVSVRHMGAGDNNDNVEDISPRSNPSTYTVDRIQKVMEKLSKHGQVEQAAIKRMKDLEMQMQSIRTMNLDLQTERDSMQYRMTEQMLQISSLQSRIDEERHRAEELHRQGTTDLTLRVHDLQLELTNATETLSSREKQIATLKDHLEQSKRIIEKQGAELAQGIGGRSHNEEMQMLETELKLKVEEIQLLKNKIRTEMVNKMSLPDIMETIMAEKNVQMDHLKEDVQRMEAKLKIYTHADAIEDQQLQQQQEEKMSARTLSDIGSISDYDVPDVMRKAESRKVDGLLLNATNTMDQQQPVANFAFSFPRSTPGDRVCGDDLIQTITPEPVPRKINFSSPGNESKDSKNLGEELEVVRKQLQEKVAENAGLEVEFATKTKLLDIVNREKKTLANKVDDLSGELVQYKRMCEELKESVAEVGALRAKVKTLEQEVTRGNDQLMRLDASSPRASIDADQLLILEQEVQALKRILELKDNQLTKLQKETLNVAKMEHDYEIELNDMRKELIAKSLELEKCKLDLEESVHNVLQLDLQIDQLKERYDTTNINPLTVDEIAERVEEELNYSAQLDSSILKAIESDDIASDDERVKSKSVQELIEQTDNLDVELRDLKKSLEREAVRNEHLMVQNQELNEQLAEFRQKYETERNNCIRMQLILESEKKNSLSAQQQDAELMDSMRRRLNEAIENEARLQKAFDDRTMTPRKNNVERCKSTDSLLRSPVEYSPRRKTIDSEVQEQILRLESELKLVTSQHDREKERVKDLQHTLDREKSRFEKEVQDQKNYSATLTQELKKVSEEREMLQDDLERVQDQLELAKGEVESLEARVANFVELESRMSSRRGRESTQNSLEIQDLRLRLQGAERERDTLQEQVVLLRRDVDKGVARELELTRTIAAERNGNEWAIQLDDMRDKMSEAMRMLAEERRRYQKYKMESSPSLANRDELEERANHLFGKYLRVESFRKALVHQKRYLLVMLTAYQENEAKALATLRPQKTSSRPKRSFRVFALMVIAIQRMKFIVWRWQSGKRVGSKAIFGAQILPRRSASASTNVWTGTEMPSRDRPNYRAGGPISSLQAHNLLTDLSENSPIHKYYRH